jgi:predicted amidohydrolase
VFELLGCRFGILICYDNNVTENVRITTLLGAEIILMPHVTCCLPSAMPGRGVVERRLWERRDRDPVPLKQEFLGPKGREWLMRWLPARAWENGVYAVFTNPVGIDDDQVRNGNAMILDPFGEVIAECNELGDGVVVGTCTPEKIELSSGRRYLRARRPELYGKLVEPPAEPPRTAPGWDVEA